MTTLRARIGPSGRLVIPAAQRRELGLKAGDEVLIRVEDDELRISSVNRRIERVQALVRKYNPKGELLSQSLIRERRAEAAKE
ncbi:MAG TPA: AbrB/MazE/SpoVT family DNA-binding domain-containing protein [Stellaceae bacterium]|nr:AbrB/MazE/SpoVT family DNA-binding domain-containing protein [Stellaceae bacterium]